MLVHNGRFAVLSAVVASLMSFGLAAEESYYKTPPQFHMYRVVLGGQGCMNNGDGFRVYANGKLLFERDRGWGKREGGPMCFYINDEWWPLFERGEMTIAVTSFLRIHKRSLVKGNMLSAFIQEMKLPPVD